MARPRLSTQITLTDFRAYYWLKEELIAFCRQNGLSTTGSKTELAERIGAFLEGGTPPPTGVRQKRAVTATDPMPAALSRTTVIGAGWRCSERLRAFFEAEIGPQFHFNQVMRGFVKNGKGKTLQAGIETWKADRNGPQVETEIGSQFEYNRHMRAYFKAHPNATREQAIAAWRKKRAQRKTGLE